MDKPIDITSHEHTHRHTLSHMMLSHIPLILPCIWWIFGENCGSHISHNIDKCMSVVLTISIILSMIYHYYYECVLCNVEYYANIINTVMLNVYMVYRGVDYVYIGIGFGLLYILQKVLLISGKHSCADGSIIQDRIDYYNNYHPYCHYIGGIYVTYCVYLLQYTFNSEVANNTNGCIPPPPYNNSR